MVAVYQTKKWGLFESFKFYDKEIKKAIKNKINGLKIKHKLHIFHTLEFHLVVFLMGFAWQGFFFVFFGMLYHSLLDIIHLIKVGMFYSREYSLIYWIKKKINF